MFLCAATVEAKECSDADARAAETGVDSLKTWSSIHSAFKQYGHCDDGGIAEGWTEAIVHLLASNWKSLPQAAAFTEKDKSFRRFFLKHIDATADTDEIKTIGKLAQSQCPAKLTELCTYIHGSVNRALGQLQNVPR